MSLDHGYGGGSAHHWDMSDDIAMVDPEMDAIIKGEKDRQRRSLGLISEENFTSKACLQAFGSCLNDKCSDGQVGQRYYGGNVFIDQMETLTKERALKVFGLKQDEWGVNVQPYSCSYANLAVYIALVEHNGRIMGLDLPDGGHLSHGYQSPLRKVSVTSLFFESKPYKIDPKTERIDYEGLGLLAEEFKPKLIITGVSCYTRDLDYDRFREIADANGSYLMADISQVGGLVAAGLSPTPFEKCHIVTMGTNEPRAAMIFYRKDLDKNIAKKINDAVDPGLQCCQLNNAIAGLGVALKQALSPAFKVYQEQVIKNSKTLAEGFLQRDYKLLTGGTDNHMVVVDMGPMKIGGANVEKVLEKVNIIINKNMIIGDKSALKPGGIRLGTPGLTSRNMKEGDIETVVGFIDRGIKLALEVQDAAGAKDFYRYLIENEDIKAKLTTMKAEVEAFAMRFPLPGHESF